VHIELEITNQTTSLTKRYADIALRMYRPTQPDLLARRLSDLPLGFFASKNYLKQYGTPNTPEDFLHHNIIGFDRDMAFISTAQGMGFDLSAKDFKFRTDCLPVQLQLARFDGGIVGTHIGLAK
ncbi:MAG: LysR substrate-binding domain-containing protein, partial [Ghiorsea sp.]|nr:LysR substrate-binding domain-containing protein [Ghiorsea sp.]